MVSCNLLPSDFQTSEHTIMETPAWMFFSFTAVIGVLALNIAMETLKITGLPSSVSPKILFLLKLFLTTASCHSSTYALVHRTRMKIDPQTYYLWFALAISPIGFTGVVCEWCVPIYPFVNICVVIFFFLPWSERFVGPISLPFRSVLFALIPLLGFLVSPFDAFGWCFLIFVSNLMVFFHLHFVAIKEQQFALIFHYCAMSLLFMFCMETPYLTLSVLFCSFLTLALHTAISTDDERLQRWPTFGENGTIFTIISKGRKTMKKKGSMIEFSIGMAGAIVFQTFFPLTSLDHVIFFFLTVAWLANLALLFCPHDFGVFNFLLGNVVVGCMGSEFGLGYTTWIVYGVSLALYILRLIVQRGEGNASVVNWGECSRTEVGTGLLLPSHQ